MLHRGDLFHDQAHRGLGRRTGRDPVRRVRSGSDGLARNDDQPGVQRVVVDRDRVETLAHVERHGRRVRVDRHPVRAGAELDPRPPKDERPVRVVLELVLRVDPTPDGHVACRTARQVAGLGDTDRGCGRQKAPDAVARAEAAQHHRPDSERGNAQDDEEEGTHGGDDTRRTQKGP